MIRRSAAQTATEQMAQRIIDSSPHLREAQERQREREAAQRRHEQAIADMQRRRAAIQAMLGHIQTTQEQLVRVQPLPLFRARPNAPDPHVLAELGAMGIAIDVERQINVMEGIWEIGGHGRRAPTPGTQNVHDRAVTESTTKMVSYLSGVATNTSALHDAQEIVREADVTEKQRRSALRALAVVSRKDTRDVSSNMTEMELLSRVTARLHELVGTGAVQQSDAYSTYALQLAEMVEEGAPVCSKGRFEHIAAILQGIDANAPPIIDDQTTRALILAKAPQLRNAYLAGNSTRQELYDADDDAFMAELRAHVRRELQREFVDSEALVTARRFEALAADAVEFL